MQITMSNNCSHFGSNAENSFKRNPKISYTSATAIAKEPAFKPVLTCFSFIVAREQFSLANGH